MSFNVFNGKKNGRVARGAVAAALMITLAGAPLLGCSNTASSTDAATSATPAAIQTTATASSVATVASSSETTVDVASYFSNRDLDWSYDAAEAVTITFANGTVTATNANGGKAPGITLQDDTLTITQAGVYVLSGSLEGSVVIDAPDDAKVQLVLDNASIAADGYAAIAALNADKLFVTLAPGTTNSVTTTGSFDAADANEVAGAIFARCDLTVNGEGVLSVTSPYHGIDGKDEVTLTGGAVSITASEDGINANDALAVAGGTWAVSAGDDGLHCNYALVIAGGTISVTQSEEGLEGSSITITGGDIDVTSNDDGLNASGEPDSTAGDMQADATAWIEIAGGTTHVNAAGDGVDSNGDLTIFDGTVYVDGPTDGANGPLDYAGQASLKGGTVIAIGASGMAQSLTPKGDQAVMLVSLQGNAGDTITLTSADGTVLLSYVAEKSYRCVFLTCPELKAGVTYTVSNGTSSVDVTMDSTSYSNVMGGFGAGPGGFGGGFPGGFGQGGPGQGGPGF